MLSPAFAALEDPTGILGAGDFQRLHEATLEIFRMHGFRTDGEVVLFTEAAVTKALSTVSAHFTLLARNPAHSLRFDLDTSAVGLGRSAAFVMDAEGRRRLATSADFIDMIRLGQALDAVQVMGNLVTPGDLPPDRLFPFMMVNQIRYSDKPYIILAADDLDPLRLAFGVDREGLKAAAERGEAYGHATVNSLSPLAVVGEQADFLIIMAGHGIPLCLSPTPATGSTGPCSLSGNLLLNNCEVLGLLVLTQLVRPGLPVLYGTFPASLDMRTMGAIYGSGEARLMEAAAARIAKAYGLLTRGNIGLTEAFSCDYQAGAESMLNMANAFGERINYLPGCGILGSFACAAREKLVLDAEMAAVARQLRRPLDFSREAMAVDVIRDVGPQGNFVATRHTFRHCRSALSIPTLLQRDSYEKWAADGRSLARRAAARADALMADYVRPALDRDVEKRLGALLAP